MSFTVGDRVTASRRIGDTVPEGTPGRVVRIGDGELSPFHYQVHFPGYPFFISGGQASWPVLDREITLEDM